MFNSILSKTLYSNRVAIMSWGLGLGSMLLLIVVGYYGQYGTDPTIRARKLQDIIPLLESFRMMGIEPVNILTAGGFVTWRFFGNMPILMGAWTILSASGMSRGEEESGATDVLLATPRSRSRVLLEKWLAFMLSLLLMGICFCLFLLAGGWAYNQPFDAGLVALAILNVLLQSGFWGTLALLFSQIFSTRRAAAGAAAGLMMLAWAINNLSGTMQDLAWLGWFSPLHYYAANKPLAEPFSFDAGAFMITPLLTLLCFAGSVYAFNRRDLGASFLGHSSSSQRSYHLQQRSPMLDTVLNKTLRDLAVPTFWWGFGLALYTGFIVGTSEMILAAIRSTFSQQESLLARMFGQLYTLTDLIGLVLFNGLPVLLTICAVTQLAAWVGEEENGRLEVLLATPQPRTRVLLSAFAALVLSMLALISLIGAIVFGAIARLSLNVNTERIFAGLVTCVPLVVLVLALGFALAAFLKHPGTAIAITSGLVMLSFFLNLIGPVLNLPDIVRNLSIFNMYGEPVRSGLSFNSIIGMSTAALGLLLLSIYGFQRRDIAK